MIIGGARVKEIIGIINSVAVENEFVPTQNGYRMASGLISGISLRVRQRFTDFSKSGKITDVSVNGRNWMISFRVNKRKPRALLDEYSEMLDLYTPSWDINYQGVYKSPLTASKMCIHTPCIIGEDEFRKEMSLLRLFSSEWEL